MAAEKVRFNAHESVLPLEKEKPTENKALGFSKILTASPNADDNLYSLNPKETTLTSAKEYALASKSCNDLFLVESGDELSQDEDI